MCADSEEDAMELSPDTLSMEDWLRKLEAAADFHIPVTITERRLLLDIARVAAHKSERVAAPISTYLLGLAMSKVTAERRSGELERISEALRAD
jgi:hypothetical protein